MFNTSTLNFRSDRQMERQTNRQARCNTWPGNYCTGRHTLCSNSLSSVSEDTPRFLKNSSIVTMFRLLEVV